MDFVHSVGILTFHRCINYGSYWQAKCLAQVLRARGHGAVILDHASRRANRAEWKCALRPTLPLPVPRGDRALYRRKMDLFFAAFETLPLSAPFDLDDPGTMEACGTVVVGSDEVWNLCHPWFGGSALFYGVGARAERLVSYAASFGNQDSALGLEPWWAEQLRRFDAVSVRDENSRRMAARALGHDPALVLDPCLLSPPDLDDAEREEEEATREPFVLIYGHSFSPWFAREVRAWARASGVRTVSIGYRNAWADEQWLDAGPHEWARAMARSRGVATNFFHGSVFALIGNRPLVCETTPYRSHKVRGLLDSLGAHEHLVGEETPAAAYDALLNRSPSARVAGRIAQMRRESQKYLDGALASSTESG